MWKLCLVCLLAVSSLLLSCGHPTTLTGITISPSAVTIQGIGSGGQAQFTAFGTFIHPSETRNITTQVTWTSAIQDVATVDNKGLATAGLGCGSTIIRATAGRDLTGNGTSSSTMIAEATFKVIDPNVEICK